MNTAKKILKKLNESVTVIIVIGIIIALNALASQVFFRWDLTRGGDYSISPATKNTVSKLDDVVIIKTYFSKNIPPKYLNLEQEIQDVLDEYQNYSNGKIKIEVIDPSKLGASADSLAKKGIPTLQFNVLKNDSFQVVNGYLGLSIEYGSKSEVIPVIDSVASLEYDLTLAIKKLTAKQMPTLGVLVSNGAISPEQMTQAYGRLKQLYSIKPVDLKKDEKIGDDISALLVVGVNEKFEDSQLKKIDAFVMKGKPVIFLVNGVTVTPETGAKKNDVGLGKLLSAYGANINNDLVADVSNGRASFSSKQNAYYMTYQVNYPLWPKVLPENMDKDNVIVGGLSSLIFPWASSLDIKAPEGANVVVLAKTTNKALKQGDTFNLEPDGSMAGGGETGQYPLAAFVTGKISSPMNQGSTDSAKVVVVGDSDFASDMFSGSASDNLAFFQNIVDGLALDSDLIKIRSKGAVDRPINAISSTAKELMRYGNIFGLSVLLLIIGFFRYFLRRRGKIKTLSEGGVKKNIFKAIFKIIIDDLKKIFAKLKSLKKAKPQESVTPSAVEKPVAETEDYKDIKN